MSAFIPLSEAVRLDAELVRIGRGASASRLAVGVALDALASSAGYHDLGFSSFEAYALERCERTGRWAVDTRALARRLQSLPRIRDALRSGVLGWSTAELLARYVSPESEREWLERARGMTVRELRALLGQQGSAEVDTEAEDDAEEATRSFKVSATREDGWLFECARKVADAVAGPMPADRLLQTLLAEGYSTLLELVPDGARSELHDIERLERDAAAESKARADWRAELGRWRDEAEELCDARNDVEELCTESWSSFVERKSCVADETELSLGSLLQTPEALDREIRRLCAELLERDLALGIVAESARKTEVWRRLGFASEAQYARERVGVSLSSLKAKRILAARVRRLPELASAVTRGRLGYEAAYLLSRVATPATVEEWIRRGEQRTVKHLREEVDAAELLIRTGEGRDQPPLDEPSLDMLFELERCIASGDLFGRTGDAKAGDWSECESSGARDERGGTKDERGGAKDERGGAGHVLDDGRGCWHAGQMSGAGRAARRVRRFGRVTLQWVVREETVCFWRALEHAFVRVSSRICRAPSSFIRFLSENFCRIWLPALRRQRLTDSGELPEYFGVYRRDAFRCASPVCTRRDVTPHHLQFRSRGGADEDENVASLCVWCHLCGVHEGRIAAEPPASRIRWRIGRTGTLWIDGRTVHRVAI